MSLTT